MTAQQNFLDLLPREFPPADWYAVLMYTMYLAIGGVLALYIRFLYNRFGGSIADPEPIARVFPLLVLVTTGVISVVKFSITLSLSLLGALSIVRFRAAIKDPEELVYLFLCIAVGLCLGAEQPMLAVLLVAVATVFIVGVYLLARRRSPHTILLTITGSVEPHFIDEDEGILAVLQEIVPSFSIQRYDLENDHGQIRVLLGKLKMDETIALISKLRARFTDCRFSFVNVENTM